MLGQDPARKFICLSHNEALARDLSLKCRRVIESSWYQEIFPKTRLCADANRIEDFQTTMGGGRFSGSFNASVTGRGADFIILDDAQTPADAMSPTERARAADTFDGAVSTRLNDPRTGAIINVAHRLHVDDFTAYLEGKEFRTLALPLIAGDTEEFKLSTGVWRRESGDVLNPTLYPPQEIESLRANSPLYFFEAQYQQRPLRESGSIVEAAWLPRYSGVLGSGDIVFSCDTAEKAVGTGSFSVCLIFHVANGAYNLIHAARVRMEFLELFELVANLDTHYRPRAILIEETASGRPLIGALNDKRVKENKPPCCVPMRTGGLSKLERLQAQFVKLKSGAVRLPEQAPWLHEFLAELCAFPNVRYTDQVDALSQFLAWVNEGLPPKRELVTNPGRNVASNSHLRRQPHPDRDPRNRGGVRRF